MPVNPGDTRRVIQQPPPQQGSPYYGAPRFQPAGGAVVSARPPQGWQRMWRQQGGNFQIMYTPQGNVPQGWYTDQGYWRNPENLSKAYHLLRTKPPDFEMPEWFDRDGVNSSYQYMKAVNKGRPWYQWAPIHENDPIGPILDSMPEPPDEYKTASRLPFGMSAFQYETMWEERKKEVIAELGKYWEDYEDQQRELEAQRQEALAYQQEDTQYSRWKKSQVGAWANYPENELNIVERVIGQDNWAAVRGFPQGMTEEMYDELPAYQKALLGVFGGGGARTGILMGGLIGLAGGNPFGGAAFGGLVTSVIQKHPSVAKFFEYLDYPATWFEQIIGTPAIAITALSQGQIPDIESAWKASALTYENLIYGLGPGILKGFAASQMAEVPDIDKIKAFELGMPGTWDVEPGAALEAYNRFLAAKRKGERWTGETDEDIYRYYIGRGDPVHFDLETDTGGTGYFGVPGMLTDLAGHIGLDPLNYVPGLASKTATKLISTLTANDVLRTASRMRKGPVETASTYKMMLQNITPTQDVVELGRVNRWLAGVTPDGKWKGLTQAKPPSLMQRVAGMGVTGVPAAALGYWIGGPVGAAILGGGLSAYGYKAGLPYLFSLKPAARAQNMINGMSPLVSMAIDTAKEDPVGVNQIIHSIANTPEELARQLSMDSLASPVGQALPLAMKDFLPIADSKLERYMEAEFQRTMIQNIAEIVGKTDAEVLRDIKSANDIKVLLQQYVDAAKKVDSDAAKAIVDAYENPNVPAAQKLTTDFLKDTAKIFTEDNVPINPQLYKADIMSDLYAHMAKWTGSYFGVEPDPTIIRLSQTLKAAQSLLLLGWNPLYLVNNVFDNLIKSAASGVLGFSSPKALTEWWMEEIGFTPQRLYAGVGAHAAAGEAIDLAPLRRMTVKGDLLDKVNGYLGTLLEKSPATRLSAEAEAVQGAQAYTAASKEYMSTYWKAGQGFERMPPQLERALDSIDPNIKNLIYAGVEGSYNPTKIYEHLTGEIARRSIDSFIPLVEADTGMPRGQLKTMLEKLGAYEAMKKALETAETPNEIRKVFQDIGRRLEDDLNQMTQQTIQADMAAATVKVQAEGLQGAFEIFDKLSYEYADHWFSHWVHMNEAAKKAADAKAMGAPTSLVWEFEMSRARKGWQRLNRRQRAQLAGIIDALGIDSVKANTITDNYIKIQDAWEGFYKLRDDLYTQMRRDGSITYEEIQTRLFAEYDKTFGDQEKLFAAIDNEFTEIFVGKYGEVIRDPMLAWRKRQSDIRIKMHDDMNSHRKLGTQSWNDFLNSNYLDSIKALHVSNTQGAADIANIAAGLKLTPSEPPEKPVMGDLDWKMGGSDLSEGRQPPPTTPPEEPPPTPGGAPPAPQPPPQKPPAPAGAAAAPAREEAPFPGMEEIQRMINEPEDLIPETTRQKYQRQEDLLGMVEAENIRIAAEYGLPLIDETGTRIDSPVHILNAIKKYAPDDMKAEIANAQSLREIDPKITEAAFKNRNKFKEAEQKAATAIQQTVKPDMTPDEIRQREEQYAVTKDWMDKTPISKWSLKNPKYGEALAEEYKLILNEMLYETGNKKLNLTNWIRKNKYYINLDYAEDIIPGGAKELPFVFAKRGKGGMGFDDLIVRMWEDGFLKSTEDWRESFDFVSENEIDLVGRMLQDEMAGRRNYYGSGGAVEEIPDWIKGKPRKAYQNAIKNILDGVDSSRHGSPPVGPENLIRTEAFNRMVENAASDPVLSKYFGVEYDVFADGVPDELVRFQDMVEIANDELKYYLDNDFSLDAANRLLTSIEKDMKELATQGEDISKYFGRELKGVYDRVLDDIMVRDRPTAEDFLRYDEAAENYEANKNLDIVIDEIQRRDRIARKYDEYTDGTKRQILAGPEDDVKEVMRRGLKEIFGFTDEQADLPMRIMDARAQAWASYTGMNPDEWWRTRWAGIAEGMPEDISRVLEQYHDGIKINSSEGVKILSEYLPGDVKADYSNVPEFYDPLVQGQVLDDFTKGPLGVNIRRGDNVLIASVFEDHNKVTLANIWALRDREGLGSIFMAALKEYADARSKSIEIGMVANHKFFRKFDWLEQKNSFTYTYDNPNSIINRMRAYVDEFGTYEGFREANPDIFFQEQNQYAPVWYRKLNNLIADTPQEVFTIDQLRGMINKGGIKADEMRWSGINELLDTAEGKITKDEVLKHLALNRIETQDIFYPDRLGEVGPKYQYVTVPGGTNYREFLLRFSPVEETRRLASLDTDPILIRLQAELQETFQPDFGMSMSWYERYEKRGSLYQQIQDRLIEVGARDEVELYTSGHWDSVSNILSHTRFDDRIAFDDNGNPLPGGTLMLLEVQSDWHQEGRSAGYTDDLVVTTDKYKVETTDDPEFFYVVEKETGDRVASSNQLQKAVAFKQEFDGDYSSARQTWHDIAEGAKAGLWFESQIDVRGKYWYDIDRFDREGNALVIQVLPLFIGKGPTGKYHVYDIETGAYSFKNAGYGFDSRNEAIKWVQNQYVSHDPKHNRYVRFPTKKEQKLISTYMEATEERDRLYRYIQTQQNKVEPAPFKKTWDILTFKRMLRYAAEHGYSRIAFPTGPLAAQIEGGQVIENVALIRYEPDSNLIKVLSRQDLEKNTNNWQTYHIDTGRSLEDYVGADISRQILDSELQNPRPQERIAEIEAEMARMKVTAGMINNDEPFPSIDVAKRYEVLLDEWRSLKEELRFFGGPYHEISTDNITFGGEKMSWFYDKELVNKVNKYLKQWGVKVEDIDIDTSRWADQFGVKTSKAHSVTITPEMKHSVLFDGQPLFQGPKGAIEFMGDQRALMRALEQSDITTPFHEIGHLFRKDLYRTFTEVSDPKIRAELGVDIEGLEAWVRQEVSTNKMLIDIAAKYGEEPVGILPNGQWTRAGEEAFAKAIERYWYDGIAPTKGLQGLFEQIRTWFLRIYTTLLGSEIDVNVSPQLKGIIDRMLTPREPDYTQGTIFGMPEEPLLRMQQGTLETYAPGKAEGPTPLMPGFEESYKPQMAGAESNWRDYIHGLGDSVDDQIHKADMLKVMLKGQITEQEALDIFEFANQLTISDPNLWWDIYKSPQMPQDIQNQALEKYGAIVPIPEGYSVQPETKAAIEAQMGKPDKIRDYLWDMLKDNPNIVGKFSGNSLKNLRRELLQKITGEKFTLAQSGVTRLESEIYKYAGIDESLSPLDKQKQLEAWLKGSEPQPEIAEIPIPAATEPIPPKLIEIQPSDIDWKRAEAAYYNNSWTPEKRADSVVQEYIRHLQSLVDEFTPLADTPEKMEKLAEHLERYQKGYIQKLYAWLDAKSRTASAAVTGPANFPLAQMEKRWAIESKRFDEFMAWSKKAQDAIRNDIDPRPSKVISGSDPDAVQKLETKIATLENNHERMKAINKIVRDTKLTQEEKIQKIVAANLISEETAIKLFEPNYKGDIGFEGWELSNNLAEIKRLKGRVTELTRLAERGANEYTFSGGRILENESNNRIQIFFDEKPSAEVRDKLRSRGFRWAPSQEAWQRQRTANAISATKELFPDMQKIAVEPEEPARYIDINMPPVDETPQEPDVLFQSPWFETDTGSKRIYGSPIDTTQTPEFRAWFGDSKVKDYYDNPITVYHGTGADFFIFDKDYTGTGTDYGFRGRGFYFTRSPELAQGYAYLSDSSMSNKREVIYPVYLKIENPFYWHRGGSKGSVENYYYDHIRLPDEIHSEVEKLSGVPFIEGGDWGTRRSVPTSEQRLDKKALSEAITQVLREKGYDGVITEYADNHTEYLVFDPEQIKSKFNRGTYDPNNPNILYQDGDGTIKPANLGGPDPDPDKLPLGSADSWDKSVPMARMAEEGYFNHVLPALDRLEQYAVNDSSKVYKGFRYADLPPDTQKQFMTWLHKTTGKLSDAKVGAIRYGEMRRDHAMLNYANNYGFDSALTAIFPYQFWYGRTALNWGLRAVDHPGWLTNYARLRNAQSRMETQEGYPTRLIGRMRIHAPWLPDFMGDTIYYDPLHQVFGFENLAYSLYERPIEIASQQGRQAIYILQKWVSDEEITEQEALNAMNTQAGPVWDKAFAQAQVELKGEYSNPSDYLSGIVGFNLPLEIWRQYHKGTPENISQLPITRTLQAFTADIVPGGYAGPEGWIREKLGLPTRGKYWDFWVDRELANMAGDGTVTATEAEKAMVEREGPVYDMAMYRVGKTQQFRFLGAAFWADFFPEGEIQQRELQREFSTIIETGDSKALGEWFDRNPEYSARLLMGDWDDPKERMQSFLVGQIWENYLDLPKLAKNELNDYLGEDFQTLFLEKETRSYNSISNETLAYWSRLVGGYVPKDMEEAVDMVPEVDEPAETFALPPGEISQQYDDYLKERKARFPDYRHLYVEGEMPPDDYLDWRSKYLAEHPDLIPYVITEDNRVFDAPKGTQAKYYQYYAIDDNKERNQYLVDNPDVIPYIVSQDSRIYGAKPEIQIGYYQYYAFEDKAQQYAYLADNPEMIPYVAYEDNPIIDAPRNVQQEYYRYLEEREVNIPGYDGDKLNVYYMLPEEVKSVYLDDNPWMVDYWNWRDNYLYENPVVIPYVTSDENPIKYASPEIQRMYYQYRVERNNLFPDVFIHQSEYYSYSSRDARKAYLAEHPDVLAYWQWKYTMLSNMPELIQYVESTESLAELAEQRKKYDEPRMALDLTQFSDAMLAVLSNYYNGGDLGAGAKKELYRIWRMHDRPGGVFDTWVNSLYWILQ